MELKTKFDLGQYVYVVQPLTEEIKEVCPVCQGKGYIDLNGARYDCPNSKCIDGDIFKGYKYNNYKITFHSKIGKVSAEMTKDNYRECYMLVDTGVGSGALWYDDEEQGSRIFANKKEAEEYCRIKNEQKTTNNE